LRQVKVGTRISIDQDFASSDEKILGRKEERRKNKQRFDLTDLIWTTFFHIEKEESR